MILKISYYILCLLGIIKKKSKILTILMLIVMWVVYGLCTYNGDYAIYLTIYEKIQNPTAWMEFEPLFNVIMYVCSSLGLSFIQFRMIFAGMYIILLYTTIGKYTENKAEVLGLYMLFPYLYFTSVIRSGFAVVLIVLAYHKIIAGNNNRIGFWIIMIIAFFIHYTSIIFVFYYFFKHIKNKKNLVAITIALTCVLFAIYYSGLMYKVVSIITNNQRTLAWFIPGESQQEIRWGIYLVVIAIMIIALSYLSYRNSLIRIKKMQEWNRYAKDVFYISTMVLVFIPFFFVSNTCARLMWQMLLFVIINYSIDDEIECIDKPIWCIRFNLRIILMVVFLLLFSFYSNYAYRGTYNDESLIFQNNLLYGSFDWDEWHRLRLE